MEFFLSRPVCDYLTVTVPRGLGPLMLRQLSSLVSECVGVVCLDADRLAPVWGFPARGRLAYKPYGRVGVFSASGSALSALRSAGVFGEYLRLLSSEGPHRVTRLDAALDVVTPTWPILRKLYRKVRQNGIRLSKKACTGRLISGPCVDGGETGTLYLGKKTAEVHAKVYDKRQERLDKGYSDPGVLTRYEVTVCTQFQPSLKDAWHPEALFWRFMAPDVLPKPSGITLWTGSGEGYELPKRETEDSEALQYKRLLKRLTESSELKNLCEMVLDVPHGYQALRTALRKLGVYDALVTPLP